MHPDALRQRRSYRDQGALRSSLNREPPDSETLYDGLVLAGRGLVVVSINYRLGVRGYLAHPGLSSESPDSISGNYGLLDLIEAV